MITMSEYLMGRDKNYAKDFTSDIVDNASILLFKVNQLLKQFGETRKVTSGWRPASYNKTVKGAASRSPHIIGKAVDLEDSNRKLAKWCRKNKYTVLAGLGLYMENIDKTVGWVHLQTRPTSEVEFNP